MGTSCARKGRVRQLAARKRQSAAHREHAEPAAIAGSACYARLRSETGFPEGAAS